jgi:CBS-domain-containing membrane protein
VSDTPEQRKNESAGKAMEEGLSEGPGAARGSRNDGPRKILRFIGDRSLVHSNGKLHVLPREVRERLRLPEDIEVVDPRFRRYWYSYLVQGLLATAAMLIILLFVDSIADAALVAGLGSSVVILFVHPSASAARPRSVVGGHALGLVVGIGCSLLVFSSPAGGFIEHSRLLSDFSLALSLGTVILVMAITNTKHPPAAGTVLGMSLQAFDPVRMVVFLVAILMLSIIQYLLRSHLHDLI